MHKLNKNWGVAPVKKAQTAIYSIAIACCAGCSSMPKPVSVDFPAATPSKPIASISPNTAAVPASGSLFQKASYRPGIEDARARLIGDQITILIVESVAASQVSSSTANRTSTGATSISAFPLVAPQDLLNLKAGIGTNSAQDFSGKCGRS